MFQSRFFVNFLEYFMDKDRRKQPAKVEQSYRSLIESIKDYAIFMLDKKGKVMSWDQGGPVMSCQVNPLQSSI